MVLLTSYLPALIESNISNNKAIDGERSDRVSNDVRLGPVLHGVGIEIIDISGCSFAGRFSKIAYIDLERVRVLRIDNNSFVGSFPSVGGTREFKSLTLFSASSNHFSGTIPWNMFTGNLVEVDVSSNQLVGDIPTTIKEFTNLDLLNLADNELSSTIPTTLGLLTYLRKLELQGNQLSGSLPSDIGRMESLEYLDVSQNHLSGTVPHEFEHLHVLRKWTTDCVYLCVCVCVCVYCMFVCIC